MRYDNSEGDYPADICEFFADFFESVYNDDTWGRGTNPSVGCDFSSIDSGMQLNLGKCKSMSFTRSRFMRHFQYELSGHRLNSADSICDLGIVFATKLNFTSSTDSLSNRSQKTKFSEEISDSINVQLGVLQGSVLGPLLFILYINDIKNVLSYSKLNLFLDDTLLYITADTLDEAVNIMNYDLVSLSQ
jgi:hypothetical protein